MFNMIVSHFACFGDKPTVFSEDKKQTHCSCICKASDSNKQRELLPVAQEVQRYSFIYRIINASQVDKILFLDLSVTTHYNSYS